MSASIDLNLIRAGIVSKPEEYRWSSYGVAMKARGEARLLARERLCRVMRLHREYGGRVVQEKSEVFWDQAISQNGQDQYSGSEWYRMMLFSDAEEMFGTAPQRGGEKVQVRKEFKREEVKRVLERGGKLTFGEAMRCRMRSKRT